jgi:hypothetical protein
MAQLRRPAYDEPRSAPAGRTRHNWPKTGQSHEHPTCNERKIMSTRNRVIGLTAVALIVLLGGGLGPATADEQAGWTNLIGGGNLDDFKFFFGNNGTENKGTFSIQDGILVCSGQPSGYMYTQKSYSDYVLQFELAFKRPDDLTDEQKFRGNSGCLIHVGEKNALGVWPRSIEVQGMQRSLGLILPIPRDVKCERTLDAEARDKVLKPVGQFNLVKIDVKEGDMKIYVNGTLVSTVSDCELTAGPIGFQSEGAETHWKNIRIQER